MSRQNSLCFDKISKFSVFSLTGNFLGHFPCFPCAVGTLYGGPIYLSPERGPAVSCSPVVLTHRLAGAARGERVGHREVGPGLGREGRHLLQTLKLTSHFLGTIRWKMCFKYRKIYESISLSSSKSYMRGEIGYVTEVNFVRK